MDEPDKVTGRVIGAALEVHRHLGPGLLEGVYEACMVRELELRGIAHRRQVAVPVLYKGVRLDVGCRLDLVVEDSVIVELKAVRSLENIHNAQVLSQLRITGYRTALLVNFNVPVLRAGLRRLVLTSRGVEVDGTRCHTLHTE